MECLLPFIAVFIIYLVWCLLCIGYGLLFITDSNERDEFILSTLVFWRQFK